jgi:hypothetical protein
MNFRIGDKVKFLNEKGEGTVTRLINKTTVGVTIEDGFEIPFSISGLVLLRDEKDPVLPQVAELVTTTREKEEAEHQIPQALTEEEEGIYLGFSPENPKNTNGSDINVWLINHTSYSILFSYSIWSNGNYNLVETGSISSFNEELVQTILRKELNDHRNFKIDAIFFKKQPYEHQSPVSNIIKLKPIKLYKENAFRKNGFITDRAMIFPVYKWKDEEVLEPYMITEKKLSKILFQKSRSQEPHKISKPHAINNPASEMEIDLHIEELLDDYSNMSNAEIIRVQLTYFQNALDKAMNEHLKRLIVIHGVGNGRLKQEVRALLDMQSSLKYYDASYARYGFGATEIVFY